MAFWSRHDEFDAEATPPARPLSAIIKRSKRLVTESAKPVALPKVAIVAFVFGAVIAALLIAILKG